MWLRAIKVVWSFRSAYIVPFEQEVEAIQTAFAGKVQQSLLSQHAERHLLPQSRQLPPPCLHLLPEQETLQEIICNM